MSDRVAWTLVSDVAPSQVPRSGLGDDRVAIVNVAPGHCPHLLTTGDGLNHACYRERHSTQLGDTEHRASSGYRWRSCR